MVTGDDLAFVRLAMRKRLVSAQRIREAVERKKWDSKDRTLAEILIAMGAIDPANVKKLASELANLERQTVSSGRKQLEALASAPRSDPSLAQSEKSALGGSKADEPSVPEHPKRIGRYEILRLIGAGAMGAVYEARDRELDRIIALKLLQGEGAPSARAIARFRREAKLAARLDHPNIVRVHGAGFEDNHHFIAMDFVDGRSVAELVAIGELPVRRAIHLARKTALAVQHAHERGVLHRDLKPANVLVDEKGEPRVTDFGLAVLSEPDESDRLTRTGAAVGTPAYMSPEQARGDLQEIDARSDVYALGATLYEMLTGGPPFEAPTFLELAKKICELEPASPRKKNPEVSEDLETICLKALEKEKADRYQSAAEMAKDLERLIEDAPIVAKPPSAPTRARRWATRHPAVAATAVSLLLLGAAAGVRWYLLPGYLTVYTQPPGAKIFVDDAFVGTSCIEQPVRAGRHELRFGLENYDPSPLRIDVARGHNPPVPARLVHEKGTVSFTTVPDGAHVYLTNAKDGVVAASGITPFEKLLPEGDYVARIEAPGCVSPPPIPIHVEKGTVLEKGPITLARDQSVLELEVEPRGTVVRAERGRLEEEVVAMGGPLRLRLGEGTYELWLSKIGWLPRTLVARVPAERRKRATLAPLRSFSRPLLGRIDAPPVVGDVDGDGAPAVFVLEKDESGRWLTLLAGGEEGHRWRVRTDARAIFPVLGDVDQDGVLDVALETRTGVEVREGVHGALVLSLQVAPTSEPPEGSVRSAVFRTKSPQGARSVGVASFWFGPGSAANLQVASWVDGRGFVALKTSCPELRGEQGSAPAVASVEETLSDDAPKHVALVALKGRVARIELPVPPPADGLDSVHATFLDVASATPRSELAIVPRGKTEEALLVCPERGPLVAVDAATGREIARWGQPGARLHGMTAIPLEKGWHGVIVRDDAADASFFVRWDSIHGDFREDALRVEREEPVFLPGDSPWAPPARRREEPSLWARGRVVDLRGSEIKERTAEPQAWALEEHLAAADLDGRGAQQVLAPSSDGRALVALGPVPVLRWKAQVPNAVAWAVGEADGEKSVFAVTPERVLSLAANDGRTLWSRPAPRGARAIALVRTRRGKDAVVLGDKVVRKLRGFDGETIWEKETPASRTIEGLGADACGCGEEDVVLGEPLALVSGKTGNVLQTAGAPPPEGSQPVAPLVVEAERGQRAVIGRVTAASSEGSASTIARFTPQKDGWMQDWELPCSAFPGPLAPTAPIVSAGAPGIALADEGKVSFLGLDKSAAGDPIEAGRVLAARSAWPDDPSGPLLVLAESDRDTREISVRCIRRTPRGSETVWARRLPPASHAASERTLPERPPERGPFFLDHGARVAFLAPSGAIVILSTHDGAWLGERRSPESELRALVASYDLMEAGGSTILAATAAGDLVAFDASTRTEGLRTDARLALRELARRVPLGFAREVAKALSEPAWENVPAAQYVLAEACLKQRDANGALAAANAAIRLAGRHPAALSLKVHALVLQARAKGEEPDSEPVLEALADLLAERPELAAETAFEIALKIDRAMERGEDASSKRIEAARKLVGIVVHVLPMHDRARVLKANLMLRHMASVENNPQTEDTDRKRNVLWLREDVLIALETPARQNDPWLRGLASLAAFEFGDEAGCRFHARFVQGALRDDISELADALERRAFDQQAAVLSRIGKKRPEWSGFVAILKRAVASRKEKAR